MRFVLDVSLDGFLRNPVEWLAGIARFAGQKVVVTIDKWQASRSARQNRYYFGAIVEPLGEFFGYYKDEMHEVLKCKFLTVVDARTGFTYVRHTSSLTTGEFETYLVRCRQWAADNYGISVQLPNEYEQSEYRRAA